MTEAELRGHLERRLPGFRSRRRPERLTGGSLNHVWRVAGEPSSVVVKYAPPHVAVSPEVPLDPSRILFEARALALFAPGGRLAPLASDAVRPPRLLDLDEHRHVLVMEDVGAARMLSDLLERGDPASTAAGRIGEFVGRLHDETRHDASLAAAFDNRPVQRSRFDLQYRPIAERLRAADVEEWEEAGERAVALGRRFLEPGRCLTMGDLWPPSVLVAKDRVRIIDWELCHVGSPAQDVGHLLAHLWMHEHRAGSSGAAEAAREARRSFVDGYREGAALLPDEIEDAVAHAGAEVLMRTLGPFRRGGLYDGLAGGSAPLREAVTEAVAAIVAPRTSAFFG